MTITFSNVLKVNSRQLALAKEKEVTESYYTMKGIGDNYVEEKLEQELTEYSKEAFQSDSLITSVKTDTDPMYYICYFTMNDQIYWVTFDNFRDENVLVAKSYKFHKTGKYGVLMLEEDQYDDEKEGIKKATTLIGEKLLLQTGINQLMDYQTFYWSY